MSRSPEAQAQAVLRRRIVGLALPICGAVVVGAGAQSVIAALLGHMGDDALYVRSVFIPVAFLVLALQEGLDISTQVGFARLRGARQAGRTRSTLVTFVRVGLLVLAVTALAVAVAAPWLASLLGVPSARSAQFVEFARWTALASVLTVPTTIAAAALRGWGRPGLSAVLSVLVATVQVSGVWLVGEVAGLGVMSVPVATAASAAVGATVALWLVLRTGLVRTVRPGDGPGGQAAGQSVGRAAGQAAARAETAGGAPGPDVDVRRLLVGIGVPVGLSYLLLTVMNFVTVWILSPSGSSVVAGYGAAAAVQTVLVVPAIGLAAAVGVVMNQQWGTGDLGLLPRTLRVGTRIAVSVYLGVGLVAFLTAAQVARLMAADPVVAEQTELYLRVVGPSLAGLGTVLFLLTLLEQLGHGRVAVGLNLAYAVLSLGVGGVLARQGGGHEALYLVVACSNLLGVVVVLPLAFRLVRRTSTRTPAVAGTTADAEGDLDRTIDSGADR